jgi:hypothetical protein
VGRRTGPRRQAVSGSSQQQQPALSTTAKSVIRGDLGERERSIRQKGRPPLARESTSTGLFSVLSRESRRRSGWCARAIWFGAGTPCRHHFPQSEGPWWERCWGYPTPPASLHLVGLLAAFGHGLVMSSIAVFRQEVPRGPSWNVDPVDQVGYERRGCCSFSTSSSRTLSRPTSNSSIRRA